MLQQQQQQHRLSSCSDSILDTRFFLFFFPSSSSSSILQLHPIPILPLRPSVAGKRNWGKENFLILEQLLPEDEEGGRKNGIELLRARAGGGTERTNGEKNG